MRRNRAQDSQLAGTHHVNEVRPESTKPLLELRAEAIEEQVETKVRIKPDRECATLQLQCPERIPIVERLALGKADTTERISTPVGERGKFTARARGAVDLVECICQKRHTRNSLSFSDLMLRILRCKHATPPRQLASLLRF